MNSSKLTTKRVDSFLARLSELAASLPSPKQKAEIDRDLDAIIEFLLDFKRRLKSVPTTDETAGLEASLDTLRHFVQIADADPLLSRALGLESRETRRRQGKVGESVDRDIKPMVAELTSLSPEDLSKRLQDTQAYSSTALKEVAAELGIRVTSKESRALIVEKIVKRAGNLAGYRYLREHA